MSLATDWSTRYSYTENNVERYAPTSGGVYRLIYQSGDKFYPFYIGRSNDLRRRLLEHISPSEVDSCIKRHLRNNTCFFRFVTISSKTDRITEEQAQIREYNPNCNG